MTTTEGGPTLMYEHAMPVAPAGRADADAPGATAVGLGRVTPSAPPMVDADGQAEALIAARVGAGVAVAADAGVAVAPLGADELDDGALVLPQAASAATAISPASSDGTVIRCDIGCGPPRVDSGRLSQRT
jgi:hypothetical protein